MLSSCSFLKGRFSLVTILPASFPKTWLNFTTAYEYIIIVNCVRNSAILSEGKTYFIPIPKSGMQSNQMKKAIAEKKSSKQIVMIAFRIGVGYSTRNDCFPETASISQVAPTCSRFSALVISDILWSDAHMYFRVFCFLFQLSCRAQSMDFQVQHTIFESTNSTFILVLRTSEFYKYFWSWQSAKFRNWIEGKMLQNLDTDCKIVSHF